MLPNEHANVCIVRMGVPAPLFNAPNPWPSLPPSVLRSSFPPSSFLFHPLLRYFRQFRPPSRNPLLPQSDLPTFLGSKGRFYQFNCRFLSKISYILLQIGYLHLWDIFRLIFRNLRMTFFHRIMVKTHETILERIKWFLNVKMINLEKIK